MAVITKQRNKFTVLYKQTDENGNLNICREVFKDYKTALEWKNALESTTSHDEFKYNPNTDIIQYLNDYAFNIGKTKWSLSRYATNTRIIRIYINEIFNGLKIKDITKENAQMYVSRLEKLPGYGGRHQKKPEYIPPSALKTAVSLLRQTFKYLEEEKIIKENPFTNVFLTVKEPNKKSPEWTKEDVIELFNKCKDGRLYIFLHLYFSLDLEISEILGLSWDDLTIDELRGQYCLSSTKTLSRINKNLLNVIDANRIIYIYPNRGTNDSPSALTYLRKENDTKERNIPIKVIQLLNEWKQIRNEKFQSNLHNLIIQLDNGKPYDQDYMKICFNKLVKDCSFNGLTLVKLRKFGAAINGRGISNSASYYNSVEDELKIPSKIPEGTAKYKQVKKNIISSKVTEFLPDTKQTEEVKSLIDLISDNQEFKNELIKRLQ